MDDRIPYMPQQWAGHLTLPPVSVPISMRVPRLAKRAAPPPVEVPLEKLALYGLLVRPNRSEEVSRLNNPGGVVVFACMIAPASFKSRTMAAEEAAGLPTLDEKPTVVSYPSMSIQSLRLTRTPDNRWAGLWVLDLCSSRVGDCSAFEFRDSCNMTAAKQLVAF